MGMPKLVLGPPALPSDKNRLSPTDSEMETGGEVISTPTSMQIHPFSAQLLPLYVIHSWKRTNAIKRNMLFSIFFQVMKSGTTVLIM